MRGKLFTALALLICICLPALAQPADEPQSGYADTLSYNLRLMKRYLSHGSKWYFTDPVAEKRFSALIHFIEDEPLDSILQYLDRKVVNDTLPLIIRRPWDAPDSLRLRGYIPVKELARQLETIDQEVTQEYADRPVAVPEEMIRQALQQVRTVAPGEGMQLFTTGIYRMPDSLKILDAIPEDMVQSPQDFRRILALDSTRSRFVEQKRLRYNDSVMNAARRKVTDEYRRYLTSERIRVLQTQKTESVRRNNSQVLKFHNDQVIRAVNDSLMRSAEWLAGFADLLDNTTIHLTNLSNVSSPLVLSNAGKFFTRVWLKNQQNDSLSVLVQNTGKRSMQLVLEDGVTFSRFRQQAVRDFDFTTLNTPATNLDKIERRYQAYTPWTIGGDGTTQFSQTYLNDYWKKGGNSALSILVVAKGFANFSSDKLRWDNSIEVRNGWVKPGEDKIQKNDDKFEIASRLGISAIQKWYYSTEVNFQTQFFNGYKYPNRENAISGFLAPGRFLFKIGMDYKPNKNLSLFISPITSKTVFVRDTLEYDKSSFGIKPGKKAYWEPGLNTDLKFTKNFTQGISFETKYRMFVNYMHPFNQFDIEWENTLNMQLTDHIRATVMIHTIYDSKILFDRLDKEGQPVLDPGGNKIREPRMQFKEFVSIGFSYKINRRVVRAREIKH
ncbi:MAG: DUF3078 domain-containing protein [Bacteroidales bacterium]|nr:DUF3078 domain-containing protein [Bacteroidales bacterium]